MDNSQPELQPTTGQDLAEIRGTLVARALKRGIDVSVASYSALKKKDGDLLSYCVWGNGADSLLPVTQKVVFMKGENIRPVFADWSRVLETFGDLMAPTGDYPRRYRVREFPDEKAIDTIGSTQLG